MDPLVAVPRAPRRSAASQEMVGLMSRKTGFDVFSRRAFLRSAATLGAAAVAGPTLAQTAMDDVLNAPRRGNWDDQFDAEASRTVSEH